MGAQLQGVGLSPRRTTLISLALCFLDSLQGNVHRFLAPGFLNGAPWDSSASSGLEATALEDLGDSESLCKQAYRDGWGSTGSLGGS